MTGALSDEDRAILDEEFQQIGDEIRRVKRDTEFNGIELFNGGKLHLQIGLRAGETIKIKTNQFQGDQAQSCDGNRGPYLC